MKINVYLYKCHFQSISTNTFCSNPTNLSSYNDKSVHKNFKLIKPFYNSISISIPQKSQSKNIFKRRIEDLVQQLSLLTTENND